MKVSRLKFQAGVDGVAIRIGGNEKHEEEDGWGLLRGGRWIVINSVVPISTAKSGLFPRRGPQLNFSFSLRTLVLGLELILFLAMGCIYRE